MAEVFISYKREERARVEPFVARLTELGVEVWFDAGLSSGDRFDTIILEGLKEAKAVLACWSPEATLSDWVRSEAEYARQLRTNVPVFIVPCTLPPPFTLIHTDDLSKWAGAANDAVWIKVVGRIAKMIGREGVAAAARAFAKGDDQTLYDFARRYPDEPTARKIWSEAEARHRNRFGQRMAEAKAAADVWTNSERETLEATLKEASSTFDAWLVNEQRITENGAMPDPLQLIEDTRLGGQQRLRNEVEALQGALAQMRVTNAELDGAKLEIARLTREYASASERADLSAKALAQEKGKFTQPNSSETVAELESQLKRMHKTNITFFTIIPIMIIVMLLIAIFFGHR